MARNQRLSDQEDNDLRVLVRAAMALSGVRVVDLTRELRFSSGAISGWLNGGFDRLSTEKKNILSEHLGIINGGLRTDIFHIWKTTALSLKENVHIFIDKKETCAHLVFCDKNCVGVFLSFNMAKIFLLPSLAGIDPKSLIATEEIVLSGKIYITAKDLEKIKKNRFLMLTEIELSTNEDASCTNNRTINLHNDSITTLRWIRLIEELISSGITVEDVRKALKIEK